VRVIGEVDPKTGYVIDMKVLSDTIKETVIEKFDHKNLNLDVEEFKNLNPTAENIAIIIYNLLRPKLDTRYELKLVLYETERNYVEYPCE
jgi:6-pyruvoyltetrahydropterin/6-carboxytetrahydropterin synthase